MRILFARHGESEANVHQIISNRDIPHHLTKIGMAQSLALSESLVDWNVQKIVASPILRAQETASIVSNRLGAPFTTSHALREFDCGVMEGRKDAEAWAAHHAVNLAWDEKQDYDFHIPDGESFNDVKARFLPFMTDLIEKYSHFSGDVLLISHGGMLHQMLPLALTNIDRVFTKHHPLRNCELVIASQKSTKLVCLDWGGIKII